MSELPRSKRAARLLRRNERPAEKVIAELAASMRRHRKDGGSEDEWLRALFWFGTSAVASDGQGPEFLRDLADILESQGDDGGEG